MTSQDKGAVGSKANPTSAFSVGEYSTQDELSKIHFTSCPIRKTPIDITSRKTNCIEKNDYSATAENGVVGGKHSCVGDSNTTQIHHVHESSSDVTSLYSFLSDGTPIPILRTEISREGRANQRLDKDPVTNKIIRLCTGCVPITNDGRIIFCSSNKKREWILPKGGWENDEKIEESAARETYEEAGVIGTLGPQLEDVFSEAKKKKAKKVENKNLQYVDPVNSPARPSSSNRTRSVDVIPPTTQPTSHDLVRLTFFPLYVSKVLDDWPESGRSRKIIDIDEAIETTTRHEIKEVLLQVKKRNLHRIGVSHNQ